METRENMLHRQAMLFKFARQLTALAIFEKNYEGVHKIDLKVVWDKDQEANIILFGNLYTAILLTTGIHIELDAETYLSDDGNIYSITEVGYIAATPRSSIDHINIEININPTQL